MKLEVVQGQNEHNQKNKRKYLGREPCENYFLS
jgi:hypothetical protein